MARIDTLNSRLTELKATLKRVSDPSAKRKIEAAIKRTERQIANAASRMGRPPRRGLRRTSAGRFG